MQGDHPLDVHDHGHDFAEDIFDDLGAVMEAVGMKGSLLILLQNSLFVLSRFASRDETHSLMQSHPHGAHCDSRNAGLATVDDGKSTRFGSFKFVARFYVC